MCWVFMSRITPTHTAPASAGSGRRHALFLGFGLGADGPERDAATDLQGGGALLSAVGEAVDAVIDARGTLFDAGPSADRVELRTTEDVGARHSVGATLDFVVLPLGIAGPLARPVAARTVCHAGPVFYSLLLLAELLGPLARG